MKPIGHQIRRLSLLLGISLLLSACFFETENRVAGTGSQGGNAIVVGRVFLADGSPASEAEVTVRRSDYLAYPAGTLPDSAEGQQTVTDALGRYQLKGLKRGNFTLFILKGSLGIKSDFVVPVDSRELQLPEDSLSPTANLKGKVVWPAGQPPLTYVQIYGVEQMQKVDSTSGNFHFDNLPAGPYKLRAFSASGSLLSGEAKVELGAGETIDTVSLTLKDSRAIAFGMRKTGLAIQGLQADNPIIYDNNNFAASLDDDYLWVKASLGANLVGIIASRDVRRETPTDTAYHSVLGQIFADAVASVDIARKSGLHGIPDPVKGAEFALAAAPAGGPGNFVAEDNAGSRLIIAEAKKATREKPLVIVVEGQPITVANALLLDSTIADRILVFGYEFGRAQSSWEAYIVAKKCRYVNCDLRWTDDFPMTPPAGLLKNPLCDSLRAHWLEVRPGSTPRWGSVSALLYLFAPATWIQADPMVLPGPDSFLPGSVSDMDFIHVKEDGVDKAAQVQEFFQTLNESQAYRP